MSFSQLKPLRNAILFQFLDDTSGDKGQFTERSRSGLYIPTLKNEQRQERWARVVAVGPEAKGINVNDFILIEPLMWTSNEVFEGQKIWKTDTTKVMMVTTDETLTTRF